MDQIEALNGFQRNIASSWRRTGKGHDLRESAGGESVSRLMASPAAKGLFARAIVASGGGRDDWPNLDEAQARVRRLHARQGRRAAALPRASADKVWGSSH